MKPDHRKIASILGSEPMTMHDLAARIRELETELASDREILLDSLPPGTTCEPELLPALVSELIAALQAERDTFLKRKEEDSEIIAGLTAKAADARAERDAAQRACEENAKVHAKESAKLIQQCADLKAERDAAWDKASGAQNGYLRMESERDSAVKEVDELKKWATMLGGNSPSTKATRESWRELVAERDASLARLRTIEDAITEYQKEHHPRRGTSLAVMLTAGLHKVKERAEKAEAERDAALARIQSAEHRHLDAERAAVEHANRMNAAIAERDATLSRIRAMEKTELEWEVLLSSERLVVQQRDAAVKRAEAAELLNKEIVCAFCGHKEPKPSIEDAALVIATHVAQCEKHPMRAATIALRASQAREAAMRAALEMFDGAACSDGKNLERWRARDAALASDAGKPLLDELERLRKMEKDIQDRYILTDAKTVKAIEGRLAAAERLISLWKTEVSTAEYDAAITAWEATKTA